MTINTCHLRLGLLEYARRFFLLALVSHLSAQAAGPVLTPDFRDFANGRPIPVENYCDQPRILKMQDGTWVCLMTTGPGSEGAVGEHVVATQSRDQGKHWTPLINIEAPDPGKSSAYAVGLVTPTDRIYAFYCYNGDGIATFPNGKPLRRADEQGWFCYRYSDDQGKTWSVRYRLPLRLTKVDLNNVWKGKLQMFWAVGTPCIFDGKVIFALTKLGKYIQQEGEGWYFCSDNILTERDPAKLHWQLLPDGDAGVRSPEYGSVQEEFDVVSLGQEDLFSIYRTAKGVIGSSYSRDGGHTWSQPETLCYYPGGAPMKNPRANPKIWKVGNGRYLLWYHDNSTPLYDPSHFNSWSGNRNLVWLSAGDLKDGVVHWSQPELITYVDGGIKGCSYPDLIEDGGDCYIFSTQKTEARVMKVDPNLLDGLWTQATLKAVATNGLAINRRDCQPTYESMAAPKINPLCGDLQSLETTNAVNYNPGGLTIEAVVRFSDLTPGQILVDTRDTSGCGYVLKTGDRQNLHFEMCDGINAACWDGDPDSLKTNTWQDVAVTVDGFPKIIDIMVDGMLGDGGVERPYGYGRFNPNFKDISGKHLRLAGQHGDMKQLRIYTRALRTSELVGNFHSLEK